MFANPWDIYRTQALSILSLMDKTAQRDRIKETWEKRCWPGQQETESKPNRNLTKQTEGVLETIELLVRKKKKSRLTRIFPGKRWTNARPIQPQMKKNVSYYSVIYWAQARCPGWPWRFRAGSDTVFTLNEFTVLRRETERSTYSSAWDKDTNWGKCERLGKLSQVT